MPAFETLTDALAALQDSTCAIHYISGETQRAPRSLRGNARTCARAVASPASGGRAPGYANRHPGRRPCPFCRHVLGVCARTRDRRTARAGQRRRAQGEILPRARAPLRSHTRHRAQGVRPVAHLCRRKRSGGTARATRTAHRVPGRDFRCFGGRRRPSSGSGRYRIHPVLFRFHERTQGRHPHPSQSDVQYRRHRVRYRRAPGRREPVMDAAHPRHGTDRIPPYAALRRRRSLAHADGAVRAPPGAVDSQVERAQSERHVLAEFRLYALSEIARSRQSRGARPFRRSHHFQWRGTHRA